MKLNKRITRVEFDNASSMEFNSIDALVKTITGLDNIDYEPNERNSIKIHCENGDHVVVKYDQYHDEDEELYYIDSIHNVLKAMTEKQRELFKETFLYARYCWYEKAGNSFKAITSASSSSYFWDHIQNDWISQKAGAFCGICRGFTEKIIFKFDTKTWHCYKCENFTN